MTYPLLTLFSKYQYFYQRVKVKKLLTFRRRLSCDPYSS